MFTFFQTRRRLSDRWLGVLFAVFSVAVLLLSSYRRPAPSDAKDLAIPTFGNTGRSIDSAVSRPARSCFGARS